MVKTTPTVLFAALGALVLGFAFAGFVVNASAASAPAAPAAAPAAADQATSNGPGAPLAGDTTGEGAISNSPCYADMPVYNKEGRFLGRGLVNTCK